MTDLNRAERLRAALDGAYALTPTEAAVLDDLCDELTIIERLQAHIEIDGPVILGQRGPRLHPATSEIRLHRAVAARLAAQLRIPDDED